MSNTDIIARNLAAAFLSGTWTLNGLVRRAALALGEKARWHRRLVRKVMASFAQPPNDRALERIVALIKLDQGFHVAGCRRLHRLFWVTPTMSPRSVVAGSWSVPSLTTPTALMEWLGLKPRELDWFAGCRGEEAEVKSGPLRHYSYRWLPKRSGKWRLLEMPKTRLKAIQGRVLHEILNRIPPHDSAHGFRRGRSIATFVAPHCGRRVVMRFDLRHFFPSVRSSRIRAVFAEAGYPREVARLLTGLCTNTVPDDVWDSCPGTERGPKEWNERQRFRVAHLPQGAPTSPALANLCAYRLDCRLQSLAKSMAPNTPAMPTIWRSPAAASWSGRYGGSVSRFARSRWNRALRFTCANPGICVRGQGSISRE